ncbi:phosphate ABC transporter substrate-binding protein [Endozoicomonas sp. SM1973]|uniref:Phosphate ABC transporter substrate-binding protein n=1 Tax=Spartinivicinus marinus TaxID=2994442 RepID=A0A853IF17_9GAMM|nr:phosphate ABC transporter substrate-binding protein [Spartinivicinus marinus]MCX4027092.1 phosphate ABC transporter substrate-binding protein [Spartinivicinus marinus]NYZ68571.1 phosphate ABC transporter substrate-binding protein [Spartinivicinus marinus]
MAAKIKSIYYYFRFIKNRFISFFTCLITTLILINASATEQRLTSSLIWMGCGVSLKAYMSEVAKAFSEKTGIPIRMAGGGATKGIRLAATSVADIGGTCRHKLTNSKGKVIDKEKQATLFPVAWDALVIIINKNNPVKSISEQQLKNIFSGKIKNWNELGGKNLPIHVVVRAGKSSGVGLMFRLMVFKDPNYEFPSSVLIRKSTGPIERYVMKTINAIAIDGISSARKQDLKYLSLNNIEPTKENIMSGAYEFYRPLYISIHNTPSAYAREFVNYILSKEGQSIISKAGTINLEEGRKLEHLWLNKCYRMLDQEHSECTYF